ncbi:Alpha beta hydrolase fold protein [Madurella fahalii]|uniref:Alpha beta hydrolase fold protein n=1 Tax=Madurella fahalii TaxID=1157608 RepID=A0ABQ0GJQ0_9PEZI
MPWLSEVRYSREATVAAVIDYFEFLAKMYIKESDILRPPEGGWPEITPDRFRDLGKTDEVILLLRHLPYLASTADGWNADAGPSGCHFYWWLEDARSLGSHGLDVETMKMMTQGSHYSEAGMIPPHVVGLVSSKWDFFLLDTELGVVYWPECPDGIKERPAREPIEDDPYDYAAENEADWRAEGPCWAVADFFEVLKDQFRWLCFVPRSQYHVCEVYGRVHPMFEGMIPMMQAVYREHGWPDLERYRKEECLRAVAAMLRENYP